MNEQKQHNQNKPKSRRDDRGPRVFSDRPKEFDQKLLEVRRVTRVVAGGRRLSFAVTMAIGDRRGFIGVGTGKGNDTSLAIAKALRNARKHGVRLKLTEKKSIPYEISAKYASSRIVIFPNRGRGLVSGASVRTLLDLGGVRDVTSKVLSGSKNKLNTARATIKALSLVGTRQAFESRGAVPVEKVAVPEVVESVDDTIVSAGFVEEKS